MNGTARIIGSSLYRLHAVGSTNTELLGNAGNYGHGSVLTANIQTAGRGRYSRKWHSAEGGLYMSILLKDIDIANTFLPFCLLSGLAVARTLEDILPLPLYIKWPNDVYAGERKICGILPESVSRDPHTLCVTGIGINVNNPAGELRDLRKPAVSVRELRGKTADTRAILARLIDLLNSYYTGLVAGGPAQYLPELNARLFGRGRTQTLCLHGKSRSIVPLAFTEQAGLLCRDDGREREIRLGEML